MFDCCIRSLDFSVEVCSSRQSVLVILAVNKIGVNSSAQLLFQPLPTRVTWSVRVVGDAHHDVGYRPSNRKIHTAVTFTSRSYLSAMNVTWRAAYLARWSRRPFGRHRVGVCGNACSRHSHILPTSRRSAHLGGRQSGGLQWKSTESRPETDWDQRSEKREAVNRGFHKRSGPIASRVCMICMSVV